VNARAPTQSQSSTPTTTSTQCSTIRRDLAAMRPLLDQMPASPALSDARRRVDTAVPVGTSDGHDAAEPARWPRAAQGARVP
jgi:hypothetical protein